MFAVVTSEKIYLPPGAVMRFPGSWHEYEKLCQLLGDRPSPRIKYRAGEILLMSPLPKHGRDVHIISMVVIALSDNLELPYEAFTPMTMEIAEVSGVELDYCFYIDNWEAVAGKDRINWGVDPSPDLAIEIDVTSYTDINDYLPYKVPEVWLFKRNQLFIYQLEAQEYALKSNSKYFPNINVLDIVHTTLQKARESNASIAIRELRQKLVTKKDAP